MPGSTVIDVAELTGFPEMMDGRVKTLHPKVHGGLLASATTAEHAARDGGARHRPIDLLVVNLYPFEATVAQGRRLRRLHREHRHRRPGDDPRRRQEPRRRRGRGRRRRTTRAVLDELAQHGGATTLALRKTLAAKAFARTAAYDAAISTWFADELGDDAPAFRAFGGKLAEALRYGENPHQSAAFYRTPRAALRRRHRAAGAGQGALLQQSQRHRRGLRMRRRVRSQAHRGRRHHQARQPLRRRRGAAARRGLPQGAAPAIPSRAFGGIVALNRPLDAEAAREIVEIFTEVIIAPDASDEANAIVARQEEPAAAARRRPARPARRRAHREVGRRRLAGAVARQRDGRRDAAQGRDQARADRGRARRPAVRLQRRQARQVERHRLCQGRRHRRHRRRPDEPRRCRAHRRAQGRGRRARS